MKMQWPHWIQNYWTISVRCTISFPMESFKISFQFRLWLRQHFFFVKTSKSVYEFGKQINWIKWILWFVFFFILISLLWLETGTIWWKNTINKYLVETFQVLALLSKPLIVVLPENNFLKIFFQWFKLRHQPDSSGDDLCELAILTWFDFKIITRTFAVSGVKSDGWSPSSGSTTAVIWKWILTGASGTINGNCKSNVYCVDSWGKNQSNENTFWYGLFKRKCRWSQCNKTHKSAATFRVDIFSMIKHSWNTGPKPQTSAANLIGVCPISPDIVLSAELITSTVSLAAINLKRHSSVRKLL